MLSAQVMYIFGESYLVVESPGDEELRYVKLTAVYELADDVIEEIYKQRNDSKKEEGDDGEAAKSI